MVAKNGNVLVRQAVLRLLEGTYSQQRPGCSSRAVRVHHEANELLHANTAHIRYDAWFRGCYMMYICVPVI